MQTNDRQISELMKSIESGNAQLPDFQRGWVWDLLRDFGYKKRTASLMCHINRTINMLGLKTYLRYYEECDISDAGLDDMIMIRLFAKTI